MLYSTYVPLCNVPICSAGAFVAVVTVPSVGVVGIELMPWHFEQERLSSNC